MKHPAERTYRVTAHNWADDSENRIHSDETAARFGFRGGLVPGVGVYSYMTRPVVDAFGPQWHERGAMTARFLKPVYDGEETLVTARPSPDDSGAIDITVTGPDAGPRATGRAWIHDDAAPDDADRLAAEYPRAACPDEDARPEASLRVLAEGTVLGSREFRLDLALAARTWVRDVREPGAEYRPPGDGESGVGVTCHPGLLLAQANFILRDNVRLGPWIHVESEVRNFAPPRDGDPLSLRGRVRRAWEHKGHEFVLLDLMMFARELPVQHILHTAIIRPREVSPSEGSSGGGP